MEPTLEKILNIIAEQAQLEPELIGTFDTLKALGIDSLDLIQIVIDLEEEFGIEIPESDYPAVTTSIAQLHDLIKQLTV